MCLLQPSSGHTNGRADRHACDLGAILFPSEGVSKRWVGHLVHGIQRVIKPVLKCMGDLLTVIHGQERLV